MEPVFSFVAGIAPLLVSIPHDGRLIPDEIAGRMTDAARATPDTDWHVAKLYNFAQALGASVLAARYSRYVVDLNRDPAGRALYPGTDNTEIVPLATFDRAPIYREGGRPDAAEIAERIARYWQPYHDRLAAELDAMKRHFGRAVLFDAHSIRSVLPRFFAGRLPDFNFGTASGASADPDLAARAFAVLDGADGYSAANNGRFTGGYITRRYGAPGAGVHAIQLELSQRCYMEEDPPFAYRPDRAEALRPTLHAFLTVLRGWTQ